MTDHKELALGTPYQLSVVKGLSELESRIVTYITSYVATRSQNDCTVVVLAGPALPGLGGISWLKYDFQVACRTVASVHDPDATTCILENVATFDDLTLGPITEVPLVKTCSNLQRLNICLIPCSKRGGSLLSWSLQCPYTTTRRHIPNRNPQALPSSPLHPPRRPVHRKPSMCSPENH